ncbi:MAG: guanylate kinase [Clostridia bacterium]|nr:guanylate kinase [Clostridia bacterium]
MVTALVIAGASCSGKTTVVNGLLEKHQDLELSRSVTTRAPRGDGNDGEYIYLDRESFESEIERGNILEYTEYLGELYGTPHSELCRISKSGKTPVLILDLKGVASLNASDKVNACAVYIWDDIEVIDKRLYERYLGTPSLDGFKKYVSRKERNNQDFLSVREFSPDFYAFIKNSSDPAVTGEKIMEILLDFNTGVTRNEEDIAHSADEMISSLNKMYS